MRAAHGWLCEEEGGFVSISRVYEAGGLERTALTPKLAVPAGEDGAFGAYAALLRRRMEIERRLVEKLGRQ